MDGVQLDAGQQHLDGEEALQYARMRKQDPLGDLGRQERQREVILKVINEGASFSSLTKYNDILEALSDNVETSLTLQEVISIQKVYKSAAETLDKLEVEGENEKIDDTWYYLVDDTTTQELSNTLRKHLELDSKTVTQSSANDDIY